MFYFWSLNNILLCPGKGVCVCSLFGGVEEKMGDVLSPAPQENMRGVFLFVETALWSGLERTGWGLRRVPGCCWGLLGIPPGLIKRGVC